MPDSTRCADVTVVLHPAALGIGQVTLADVVKEGARRVLFVFDEDCDRRSIYIESTDSCQQINQTGASDAA